MVDFIESLTILNDHTINRLIQCNRGREKMKTAVSTPQPFCLFCE